MGEHSKSHAPEHAALAMDRKWKLPETLSLRERAGATASGLTRRVRARMPNRSSREPSPERLFLRLRPIGLALRGRSALSRWERA